MNNSLGVEILYKIKEQELRVGAIEKNASELKYVLEILKNNKNFIFAILIETKNINFFEYVGENLKKMYGYRYDEFIKNIEAEMAREDNK